MDRQLKQDMLIEETLRSQPLAPMRRSITANVMQQIQTAEAERPSILSWSDFALGFVIASCLGALWFALENLPPLLLAKLRIQGILLYQDFLVNSRWLVPALFFGAAAVLVLITIPSLYKMTMDHRR